MNKTERHTAAAARLDEIGRKMHELSASCESKTKGMTTDLVNKIWRENYQPEYNALFRKLEAAGTMYFYTGPDVAPITKQADHRHAVAKMRAAGLRRMVTV